MGIESGYQPILPSRAHLLDYLPSSQTELPPRSMQDSFIAALIPLSTDKELQDKYITFLGHVRVGRLLEDMDLFAGKLVYSFLVRTTEFYHFLCCFPVMVAEKHIKNPKSEGKPFPYTLVTVLVDKIDFSDELPKVSVYAPLQLLSNI